MSQLKNINRKKITDNLGNDLISLLEVARAALNSWPIRMRVELATMMSEESLESLAERLEAAINNATPGGSKEVVSGSYGETYTYHGS